MARTAPEKSIQQIREFTSRKNPNNIKNWLPSIVPPPAGKDFSKEYLDTFTLEGTNVIPQTNEVIKGGKNAIKGTSKGEIDQLTIFGKGTDKAGISYDNSSLLEPTNLNRFYLILYCLQNSPYFFEESNTIRIQKDTDVLMTRSLSKFLEDQQTNTASSIKPYSNGFAADSVRTYRSEKAPADIKDDKDIATILEFARTNQNYLNYVAGSLGKVAYDSIVKSTLYSILKKEGIISQRIRNGEAWDDEASKLPLDSFGYWIDPSGGTYTRGFPVICVFTNSNTKKTEDDLIKKSNEYLSSVFFRKIGGDNGSGKDQLVIPITKNKKPVGGEKYFIELPNRQGAGYTYCFIYDFAKVITLEPDTKSDYTLDLLKIGLSFLSRSKPKQSFTNKAEFISYYQAIKRFLELSFTDSIEKEDFSILLKNKHSEECSYSLAKSKENFDAKFKESFRAELKQVLISLENSYSKIIEIFDQQTKAGEKRNFQFENYPQNLDYPIILHYDNFYNLLAVTSINISPQDPKKPDWSGFPFVLEDYVVNYSYGNLIKEFFANKNKLPTIPANVEYPVYDFSPDIALGNDIVLITDVFLRQLYNILDDQKDALVYESGQNNLKDSVLKADSIKLLEEIEKRTGKKLVKENYFVFSSNNKIYLKKEIVRKLSLEELSFSFASVKEDKIKFQTISRLLFLNLDEEKKTPLTPGDFKDRIYYPILEVKTSPDVKKSLPDPEKQKNRDFLINNIISSELKCYEDIANSFDKALNADKVEDKVYYAFQSLVNIGLPILLAMAAQALAEKLKQLKQQGDPLNQSLLECVSQEEDNLKKNIIGFLDIVLNLDDPSKLAGFLTQGYFELPKIPNIPFFLTFDAEKELKRRLVKFVIDLILKKLSMELKKSLQSLIDMCNADSYITAFLSNAFPNDQKSGIKNGLSTPSGYPVNASNIYIPTIIADINILIDQSGVDTRENVYEYFRQKYNVREYYYSDNDISEFFSYLSNAVDAGELASLLKGSSTPQVRNTIVGYVKNYTSLDFYKFLDDIPAVSDLFAFLALYIDYNLCYGIISSELNNFSADVCADVNSLFSENALAFGEIAVEDKIVELTKNLNEICELKRPLEIDLLASGPSLLTNTLKKSLQAAVNSNIDTINSYYSILLKDLVYEKITQDFVDKIGKFPTTPLNKKNYEYKQLPDFPENAAGDIEKIFYLGLYSAAEQQYIFEDKFDEIYKIEKYFLSNAPKGTENKSIIPQKDRFVYYMNKISNDYSLNLLGLASIDIPLPKRIENLKNVFKVEKEVGKDKLKNNFLNKLNNSGNIGLKTELVVFDGYIRKLEQLKKDKAIIVKDLTSSEKKE